MADIGGYALRFALMIATLGFGTAILAGVKRRPEWTRVSERSLWLVFGLATLAIFALMYAFVTFDAKSR